SVLPFGAADDRPDYSWADGVTLRVHSPADGSTNVTTVPSRGGDGPAAVFTVRRAGDEITVETDSDLPWHVLLVGGGADRTGGRPDTAAGPRGPLHSPPAGPPRLSVPWRCPAGGPAPLLVRRFPAHRLSDPVESIRSPHASGGPCHESARAGEF